MIAMRRSRSVCATNNPPLLIRIISRLVSEIVQNLSFFLIAFVLASYVWPIFLFQTIANITWSLHPWRHAVREDLLLFAHRIVQSHCTPSAYCNDIVIFIRCIPHFNDETHRCLHTISRWKGRWCFLISLSFRAQDESASWRTANRFYFLPPVYMKPWNMLNMESPFAQGVICHVCCSGREVWIYACMRNLICHTTVGGWINRWIKDPD